MEQGGTIHQPNLLKKIRKLNLRSDSNNSYNSTQHCLGTIHHIRLSNLPPVIELYAGVSFF